eukprot:scaffold5230_cov120-Isochrysis_galbana.AAC.3
MEKTRDTCPRGIRGDPSGPAMASNFCSCSSREIQASSGSDANRVVVTTEGPAPVSANVVLIVRAESTRYRPSPFFRHNTRSRTYRQCRGYSVNGVSITLDGCISLTVSGPPVPIP